MRRKSLVLTVLLLFSSLVRPLGTEAGPVLKIVNGRVKEVSPTKQELVLSYRHPVSGQPEKLVIKVDQHTAFNKGLHFEDFKEGDPVSVDYEENPSGTPRAVQVKRVDVSGVPEEIAQFRH